ncbi:hypothetical protein B4N89_46250 [Embleya scabrispora]|uniref:Uncharacterized protein n=1 Tax=Embleya scabrispora TaxID=159449 RepID=A0A1T3NJ62_9ACTN|nr:hypothetical protein B4N89_46250 [Embleya scabrispora]
MRARRWSIMPRTAVPSRWRTLMPGTTNPARVLGRSASSVGTGGAVKLMVGVPLVFSTTRTG